MCCSRHCALSYMLLCVAGVIHVLSVTFFFFKKKTAYVVRISDWSSDVCSSDLVGLLRTLPPAEPYAIERLHRTARALGIGWPEARSDPDFIRSLDPTDPRDVAMMTACTTVLRGAGYVALDGGVPAHSDHSALASQYAHATAPLRRLVDRYVGETCLALCAGTPVPQWVDRKSTRLNSSH